MAALEAAIQRMDIHALDSVPRRGWMVGSSPAMTKWGTSETRISQKKRLYQLSHF